jgi:hypothetical protein
MGFNPAVSAFYRRIKDLEHFINRSQFTKRIEIVRKNGDISKCFDVYYSPTGQDESEEIGDFLISDELRKCLLDPSSESYDIAFQREHRQELLYHIFSHLVLGGRINQFEDNIGPYLQVTKMLYKDMVRWGSLSTRANCFFNYRIAHEAFAVQTCAI